MAKEIILADNAGFCFGVKRAVDMVAQYCSEEGVKVYTLGHLIHNTDVIRRLEERSIHAIKPEQIKELDPDSVVVIRSHGVTPQIYDLIKQTGAAVVDATCPYVRVIHKKVEHHYRLGYQIVIVGDQGHGSAGYQRMVRQYSYHHPRRKESARLGSARDICVVAQTTERLENYEQVLAAVKAKYKNVAAFNTICTATKDRQESAAWLGRQVDLMIVIGSKSSSNTRKLVEISQVNCANTVFAENRSDLPLDLIKQEQFTKSALLPVHPHLIGSLPM